MRLFIAEKPSMGREIAANLPGPARKGNGFIETAGGVVTWLFGHVLRQAEPQEYDEKYKVWRAEDLPIVPDKWKLLVSESSAKQFAVVKQLISRADEIIHAGDPDREGQLLVDEVLEYVGCKKPVRRILLNALDEKSIKEAIAGLRPNSEFFNLRQSALARARADWLIGMNLSRAYTLAAQRSGHRKLVLPVGRVKTPTLALVVRREREIENFQPVDYYNIKAQFQHAKGSFLAMWKPKDTQPGLDSEGRLLDAKIAEAKLQLFGQEPREGIISGYSKTKKQEQQRLPFSLSTLQVLAGRRFGYSPQQVLDTAQKLYEQKQITYPRSDCEYLPTNQFKEAGTILRNLQGCGQAELSTWAAGANEKIKSRAWNDKKISAHHAIIPTRVKVDLNRLGAVERNIYFLIAQAYLAQFYPVHTFYQTKVEVKYKEELFAAGGRTEIDLGWKALYAVKKSAGANGAEGGEAMVDGTEAEGNENSENNASANGSGEAENALLPPMKKGDGVQYLSGQVIKSVTKPPSRFSQSSLVAAMKDIHKFVKDPEAKKQLKAVYGIGTEATRASILDELIYKRKLLVEKGKKKQLQPAEGAYMLIDAMPKELADPDFTAIWEDRLHSMAEGEGTLEEFLQGQIEFTAKLCAKANETTLAVDKDKLCPRCGIGILQQRQGKNGTFWGCSNYPRCRMSCDDKDGKPDLEGAARRRSNLGGFAGAGGNNTWTGGQGAAGNSRKAVSGTMTNAPWDIPGGAAGSGYSQRNSQSVPEEEIPDFGNPYMSEEEMAAFTKEYMK